MSNLGWPDFEVGIANAISILEPRMHMRPLFFFLALTLLYYYYKQTVLISDRGRCWRRPWHGRVQCLDHIARLACLEMWPVVTDDERQIILPLVLFFFAVLVSTVIWWVVSVSSQKVGLAGRGGLYKYSINTYCTSKSNRSGFSGHAKYPQFRSHRNSCFFTWRSRHLFIPVTSDFSHCISLPSRRAAPSLPSPPSSFVRECDPSRRSDAPDFTEALQIRDCMTF